MLSQTIGEADAAEGHFETLDDVCDRLAKRVERLNARPAPKRLLTRKDYVAGHADIVVECGFISLGHRYELAVTFGAIDIRREPNQREIIPDAGSDLNLGRACHRQDDPVLIGEVQLVDCMQGAVPSTVRFCLPHQAVSYGAGFADILVQPGRKLRAQIDNGEVCIIDRSSICERAGGNQVIEGCTQVVNDVTDDRSELQIGEEDAFADAKSVALTLCVRLERNLVWALSKEAFGLGFKLNNVALRPLNL